MTNMGRVDFYEIWDGEDCLVEDVGFMGEDTQGQADALARRLSPTATAHYDRTGEVMA